MKVDDVRKIIKNEKLLNYNLNMDGKVNPDEIILLNHEEGWFVGITDERAAVISKSIRKFETEEEACEDFVKRLRSLNKIRKLSEKIL